MHWTDYEDEFAWDGTWRDVCVLHTDINDWQKFISCLEASEYKINFSINGLPTRLPDQVMQIFESKRDKGPTLSIAVDDILLHCYFFREDEIELDFDPRAVKSAVQAEALFTLMKRVGTALGKAVRMTPENVHGSAIFEFDPADQSFLYFPGSSI